MSFKINILLLSSVFLFLKCVSSEKQYVFEVDDRIIEFVAKGKWLVTFYAPWCGHCKKLEPVIDEIGKFYNGKSITIARVDATRFVKAANNFDVKGYPTIKYIDGHTNINYNGERRKEDIIEFIERINSPRVGQINTVDEFESFKKKKRLFFLLFAKPEEQTTETYREFHALADRNFLDVNFYITTSENIFNNKTIETTPQVAIAKDNELIFYKQTEYSSLSLFVLNERFLPLAEVTMTNFHNLVDTKKILIILLIKKEENVEIESSKKISRHLRSYSIKQRNSYHKEFQFGYTDNNDLLSGIAIWSLSSPVLFIFNATSHTYSLVDVVDEKKQPITIDIDQILDSVRDNKIEWFGGQSFFRTLKKPFWELYRAILEMLIESPFLSLLIFGFPMGIISIVIYFICCLDSSDQPEDENEYSDTETELDEKEYLENEDADYKPLKEGENGKNKME